MRNPFDGIVLIDKEEGLTSFEVVKKVRAAFGRTRARKVGHAGTLDPFATGLLIVLLGQGTKLSPFIMSEKKVYLGTLLLGVETDTLDPTGKVVSSRAVPDLTMEIIEEAAGRFLGEIEQVPPAYSAVKVEGQRAYKLARQGAEVALKKRKVNIHSLGIVSVDLPRVTLKISCSSGTYIRSLAADLGSALGPGAHLLSLRRLSIGAFRVGDALGSQEIKDLSGASKLEKRVISLSAALPGMGGIEIGEQLAGKVRKGYQPVWKDLCEGRELTGYEEGLVKLVRDGSLVAIVRVNSKKGVGHVSTKVERVFS